MKKLVVRAWLVVVVVVVGSFVVGCLGGQTQQTKERSAQAGDRSGDVPPATLAEHDWKKAAQGHGAAGAIPPEELARMNAESAPGGNVQRDAGH